MNIRDVRGVGEAFAVVGQCARADGFQPPLHVAILSQAGAAVVYKLEPPDRLDLLASSGGDELPYPWDVFVFDAGGKVLQLRFTAAGQHHVVH